MGYLDLVAAGVASGLSAAGLRAVVVYILRSIFRAGAVGAGGGGFDSLTE